MKTIPNTPEIHQQIRQLIADNYYTGELSPGGFILKRNYGIRRLTLYGTINENHFEVKAKNELFHQILYAFGYILILALGVFLIFKGDYGLALLILAMIGLVTLADRQRKKQEIDHLLRNLELL